MIAVFSLAVLSFLTLSFPLLIEIFSNGQTIIRLGSIPLKHVMILSWHPFHLILTLLVTIVLIFTYHKIAKAMDEKFWYPLYEQISDIRCSFRSLWSRKKSKSKKSTQESNTLDLSLVTENLELTEMLATNCSVGINKGLSTNICSLEDDSAVHSNRSITSKQEWVKKRGDHNRKITSIFFFVSFMFIVLAIPTTTTVIFILVYCRWIQFQLNLFY